MEKHVTAVGAIHIGCSVIRMMIGLFLFTILAFLTTLVHEQEAQFILPLIGAFLGGWFILTAVLSLIGGIGVLKHTEWARILVLVLSAIKLINIPFGTIIGIYSLWVLVQDETVVLFRQIRAVPVPAA